MFIYLITNKANGKKYVGQTIKNDPFDRFKEHLGSAKAGSTYPVHAAIRKYGAECFTFEVLESAACSEEQLDNLERFWIHRLESANMLKGYNVFLGGTGGATNESARKKKSEKLKGRAFSEETRKKMSESAKRIASARWTPERKAKHAARMRGSGNPSFGKPFPGNPLSGTIAAAEWIKLHPETHRSNCIKASKKSWENLTPEEREARITPMRAARWKGNNEHTEQNA